MARIFFVFNTNFVPIREDIDRKYTTFEVKMTI